MSTWIITFEVDGERETETILAWHEQDAKAKFARSASVFGSPVKIISVREKI